MLKMEKYGNKGGGGTLLARWTTDFDCGYETDWWYVICDKPYDISTLKSKKRYEINRARKKFTVRAIDPSEYAEELFAVQTEAYKSYPKKYRPVGNHDSFIEWSKRCKNKVFAAFLNQDGDENSLGLLCGYSIVGLNGKCIEYFVHKAMPEYEKDGVNFALVDGLLQHYEQELKSGYYISNGQRSTNHETAFNDFLERYFQFRKAYCKLHIIYRPVIRPLMPVLYLFRKPLKLLDGINKVHLLNSVLTMEEARRKCKKA